MSWLRTSIASGVPSVSPSSERPDRISTVSGSRRWVVIALCPGRRRSSSRWISATAIGRRGGQPSTITPTAGPCDSPNVVTRNSSPKLLPAIRLAPRQDVDHAAVDGLAGEHEHAATPLLDLEVEVAGRAVAPDVGAPRGALGDLARDVDGGAPRQP